MAQREIETLNRVIPILNGLIYSKKENREAILKDDKAQETLFGIFKY